MAFRDLVGGGPASGALDSQRFLLGSDEFGRDVAARLLAGGRVSLAVAGWTVLLISLVALPLGAATGSAPPAVDRFVLRALEALQSFPRLFLLLGLAAIVRPGVVSVVLILGLTGWIPMARLVRSRVAACNSAPSATANSSSRRAPPAPGGCGSFSDTCCPTHWRRP